jgi:DtxR family Mn-dependent transcriptional regulator
MNAILTRPNRQAALDDEQPTPVERTYLEVIFYLASRREPVIAAHLARWMRVRPPTVTNVIQRLERKELIARDGAGAILLTGAGSTLAEQIVRRHRLLECFLFDVVGIPWHQVHQEAIRLEPGLSPAFEARIEVLVGSAACCPHGNPIPGQGSLPHDDIRLSAAPIDARFVVTRIDEEAGEDACTLQLLSTRGLLPGTALLRLPDSQGAVAVRRADHRVTLSHRVAGLIWGECTPPAAT